MLLIGFRGLQIDTNNPIYSDIKNSGIGGVILFDYDVILKKSGRNIESPEQLRSLINSLQEIAETPLFISVDQEGGNVNRLKPELGFPATYSHKKLGIIDDPDFTYQHAAVIAKTLADLGFNLNFAPVVDLNINPENPIIGKKERSFSDDPQKVIRHAAVFIKAHRDNKIIATLKHFPGHGSSKQDTHLGMADVTDSWMEKELNPYKNLIKRDLVDMIMTTHIFNANLDRKYPATLSKPIQTGLLREKIGYRGVLVSDDLQMKAIADHFTLEDTIRLVINAGVDILVFGNNTSYQPELTPKIIDIIYHQVQNGIIPEARIEESFLRIMNLKQKFALD